MHWGHQGHTRFSPFEVNGRGTLRNGGPFKFFTSVSKNLFLRYASVLSFRSRFTSYWRGTSCYGGLCQCSHSMIWAQKRPFAECMTESVKPWLCCLIFWHKLHLVSYYIIDQHKAELGDLDIDGYITAMNADHAFALVVLSAVFFSSIFVFIGINHVISLSFSSIK